MPRNDDPATMPSRRDTLKYGGSAVVGSLLAGCASDPDAESTTASTTTDADTDATTDTTTGSGEYTVDIAPTGEITFQEPPEKAIAYTSNYGDMLVALGQGDALDATLWGAESYPRYPYEDVPDLEFSPDQLGSPMADGALSKERLYEMDPDVIHVDPTIAVQWFGLDEGDVEEISENIAPFAANYIRRKGDEWHDYPYYSLYEAFEKIATVYQAHDRYEAFKALHDDTIASIRSRLPPAEDRPAIALITLGSDTKSGDIVGLPIEDQVGKKQYFDLAVENAFADLETEGAFYKMDYEGLLEVDPDTIVVPWGMLESEESFQENFVRPMTEDPVASELSAVKNDRVFRGGTANQGPIVNLKNTELAAQQLYPDEFGGETLYDRQQVADIVNGEF